MIDFHTLTPWIKGFVSLYLVIEALFYVCYSYYLVPKANQLREPPPYRDYGNDRHKLLIRIMKRIRETCELDNEDVKNRMVRFLRQWFHKSPNSLYAQEPDLSPSPSSSPENSDDEDDLQKRQPVLFKEDMDDFFSWAFFGKRRNTLHGWEEKELDRIYHELKQAHNLVFPPKSKEVFSHHFTPRCMTLEPLNAIHRPLLVYIIVYIIKICGGMVLRAFGYHRILTSTGLVGWYKPAEDSQTKSMPLLFFHGIAPGGLFLYLPMVLSTFGSGQDRPIFLFENRAISCALDFAPLTEQQTIDGIVEVLQRYGYENSNLSLVGHSFGSCPITWVLASRRLPNIKQIVLLDPVTILLSDPDVMVNFLYADEISKIRMVASSELFTEYYLRRHFAWYNSELWLDAIPDTCQLLVCLAENDEIINAKNVKREIQRHSFGRLIYWQTVGHAAVVSSPTKWGEVKQAMLEQELKIIQAK